jgi:DNA-binding NarL/FixJ family response regulator
MPSVFLLRRTQQALHQARAALFDEIPSWHCLGVGTQMHEALQQIEHLRPDFLACDLRLVDGHAGTLLRRLAPSTRPRVLVLSALADDPLLFETLCGGAQGYWLDGGGAKGLGLALAEAWQGTAAMSPALARQILQAFELPRSELKLAHCVASGHDLSPAAPGSALSSSDQHLLSLIAQGLLEGEIAQRWQLARREVGRRLAYIYEALHRQQAGAVARFKMQAAPYR